MSVAPLWKGQVGVAEKLVAEAKWLAQPLVIQHGDGIMEIPHQDLPARIAGYSEWFHDRWGRGKYRLVYFIWKPTEQQAALL